MSSTQAGISSKTSGSIKIAPPRWFYYVIFVISGFSGLIYQSIWSHYLKLFLGHAALAQSLVLLIFMGGMAVGAWWASKLSNRLKSPILVYAIVEVIIGIAALLFHNIFSNVIDLFYGSLLPAIGIPAVGITLKWFTAAILITPQSILLGMTFPLMTAGILRRYPDTPGASVATLYFTNSIGAAVGVLASGFVFIKLWGLPGCVMTAGLLNIILAMFTWISVRADPSPATQPLAKTDNNQHKDVITLFLIVAAITGAASFIYEIAWIRMLSMVLGSSTHSFELMLSAFITGLALGGLWIRKRIDRIDNPVYFLAKMQLIMGALAVLTIPVYGNSFEWMSSLVKSLVPTSEDGYFFFTLASHLIALIIMLPATFIAGTTLPLLTHILLQKGVGEASIGRVYASNTFGSILGILFAVHLGMPLLGLKNLIIFGGALDIALGILIITKALDIKLELKRFLLPAGTIACFLFVLIFSPLDKLMLVSGVYRHGNLLPEDIDLTYHKDGKTASISFFTSKGVGTITTNGKPDAGIKMDKNDKERILDESTMILAGAIPLAYKKDAKKASIIGLGSGLTTHTILADPDLEVVDTVEIESSVVGGSKLFGEHVTRAHNDPRSKIRIEDAKTFYSVNNKKYDIIIAEPSNPWVSGVASLFSSEFYKNIQNYIEEDGIFLQWIQLYEFNDDLLLSILKALDSNFEDYHIYFANSIDLLIIASKQKLPQEPDWSPVFNNKTLSKELSVIKVRNRDELMLRRVGEKQTAKNLFNLIPAVMNSDYFPYVDLNAAQARFRHSRSELFSHWGQGQLPALEILAGHKINFSNLEHDIGYKRSSAAVEARQYFQYLTTDDNEIINKIIEFGGPANELTNLKLIAEKCNFKEFERVWTHALFGVALVSLHYLNAEDATELVDFVSGKNCDNSDLTKPQRDLSKMFRAIAARNIRQMAPYGKAVLGHEDIHPEIKAHASYTVLLGYIANANYKKAHEFYENNNENFDPSLNRAHSLIMSDLVSNPTE